MGIAKLICGLNNLFNKDFMKINICDFIKNAYIIEMKKKPMNGQYKE